MSSQTSVVRNSIMAIISLVVIYTVFFFFLDRSFATFMNNHYLPNNIIYHYSQIIDAVINPAHLGILSVVLLVIGFFTRKNKPWGKGAFAIGLTGIVAFIITCIFKFILARYRPEAYFHSHLYGFHFFSMKHAFNSTPSGHATMAFAFFGALAVRLRIEWVRFSCVVLTCILAITRLIVSAHFVSDVIFGAYIGMLSVYWVNAWLDRKGA
jgi:membrane-associated phospholipid phosphatase